MAHQADTPSLPPGLVQPQTIITLKTAMYGDIKQVWIAQDRWTVTTRVNEATTRLIELTQVKGMKPYLISVAPGNVTSVEECS